jgi:hypothetical protein
MPAVSLFIHARWSTIVCRAMALIVLLAPVAAYAQLEYREVAKAPPSWMQFAKLVKYRFETWMAADDEVARRFRTYCSERAGQADGPPQTLVVRAWLNPDGTVERVAFASLKDQRADEDLRTILKRGNVGEAPPPEMLQPVHLSLSLNLRK